MIINGHDIRQLNLIQDQLLLFNIGKIDLGILVGNLEALIENMNSVDKNWKESFRSEWANLEVVYADFLYQNKDNLNDAEKKTINESVSQLNKIIKELLENYLNLDKSKINLTTASFLDDNWIMCPECLEAWQPSPNNTIVICPKCNNSFYNPCYYKNNKDCK